MPEKKQHDGFADIADSELVSLAQQGSEQAFTELIRRHQRSSLKQALSILRDPHAAEDEVQNACWNAWRHIGDFQQESKFSTWLTRIVTNQCLMRLREARRAPMIHLDELGGEGRAPLELVDRRQSPEDELASSEARALLEREMRKVPPLLRSVLISRHLEGLDTAETARRLGISVPAVKSRLLRAHQELRRRLEPHCNRIGPAALLA